MLGFLIEAVWLIACGLLLYLMLGDHKKVRREADEFVKFMEELHRDH